MSAATLRRLRAAPAILLALLSAAVSGCGKKAAAPVEVPAGIDHTEWNRLVRSYVDPGGLVDYGRWKSSEADRRALSNYLAQFAPPASRRADGPEKHASLVNGYNAFTISWILDHYPTESIQSLPGSFSKARHRIGGRDVSLDDIEHGTLRPEVGFLTHAAVVCAARSCPPLAREAFRADRFMGQVSYAMLRWMAREDLNRFEPGERRVWVSKIFQWYSEDFEKEKGGLRGVLSLYAPDRFRAFVADPACRIEFLDYDWGLNDQGPHGRNFHGAKAFWERVKARLRR